MIFPRIHLNGTSKERLLEGWEEAYNALRVALEKLAETAPNGRDFYPIGPEAIQVATKEHQARMEKVRLVMAELQELCEEVAFK